MNYQEIENNTNLQNILWHTGIMQYPSPITDLVDPGSGRHVVLGVTDFEITNFGSLTLGPTAFAKAESRGIPAENLRDLLDSILTPGNHNEGEGDTLDNFLKTI